MYTNRNKNYNGRSSIVSSIADLLSKGWETIVVPSNARCEAYSTQAKFAQEKMCQYSISRRERKFWVRENDKAMDGLADVHNTNGGIFIKAICAVGVGLLIGCNLLNKNKK